MLKSLKNNNIYTTPFVTAKDWQLSNVINDDILLTDAGEGIIMEYVDYGDGTGYPTLNTDCLLALDQQENDKLTYREGEKHTGIFYPDQEVKNVDGTYKRLVFSQIKTVFYNNYKNPTQIWGLENIDFPKSETIKFITDKMRVFDVPTRVLGEKILENTVEIVDNSIDNKFVIEDDGHNNLFDKSDIFSKFQEVGDFDNEFVTGSATNCTTYFSFSVPNAPISLSVSSGSAILSWIPVGTNTDGFVIEKSLDSGSTYSQLDFVPSQDIQFTDNNVSVLNTYYYRMYAFNSFGNSNYSNTASITFDIIITMDSIIITMDSTIFKMDNI